MCLSVCTAYSCARSELCSECICAYCSQTLVSNVCPCCSFLQHHKCVCVCVCVFTIFAESNNQELTSGVQQFCGDHAVLRFGFRIKNEGVRHWVLISNVKECIMLVTTNIINKNVCCFLLHFLCNSISLQHQKYVCVCVSPKCIPSFLSCVFVLLYVHVRYL